MSYDDQDQTAEVTEDYQAALDGLTMNSRYEIINLTQIARENTNYAFPISETLQTHIKKVAPQRKLPALYVLDSIVKNIGTPYTLFFGKGLYNTFMEAYASVDNPIRVKMAEMLRTWKEPVPGSIDRNPVFPIEVTRPIENALIKARTSALQAEQEHQRTQQYPGIGRTVAPYRDISTPPGGHLGPYPPRPYGQPAQYPQHPGQPYPPTQQPYGTPQQVNPYYQPPPSTSLSYQAPPPQAPHPAYPVPTAQISGAEVHLDIQNVLNATKDDFAARPFDASIQGRLKALLDLQGLLQSANLPPEQLLMIKEQVTALSVKARPPLNDGSPATPVPLPVSAAPYGAAMPAQLGQTTSAPVSSTATAPAGVSLDALLGKGALAALLSRQQTATPQVSTPSQPPAATQGASNLAALRSPVIGNGEVTKSPTPAPANPLALLSALRGAGLLGATPTPDTGARATPPPRAASSTPTMAKASPKPAAATATLPLNLASILANAQALAAKKAMNPVLEGNGIQLTPESLNQFRPYLLPALHEGLGPQCTQCGRRFKTDDEGKKKKVAHMDWHFRIHQRIAEAEKRGQHRSWFVDEADWVKSRELADIDLSASADNGDSNPDASSLGGNGPVAGAAALAAAKIPWIRVPEDGSNTVCPIDQEKFETKWLADVQEWVWTDAMRVGNRVFHASCYAEVSKGGGAGGVEGGGGGGGVLGKRKAVDGSGVVPMITVPVLGEEGKRVKV